MTSRDLKAVRQLCDMQIIIGHYRVIWALNIHVNCSWNCSRIATIFQYMLYYSLLLIEMSLWFSFFILTLSLWDRKSLKTKQNLRPDKIQCKIDVNIWLWSNFCMFCITTVSLFGFDSAFCLLFICRNPSFGIHRGLWKCVFVCAWTPVQTRKPLEATLFF